MELGTGIFLSALVIAVVMLYGITKDRWKWRLIIKRTLFVFLGLVLCGVLVGTGAYLYQQIPTPLTKQTEYAGIRLGMGQDEVLYVKGYPSSVVTEEEVADPQKKAFLYVLETNKLDKGKSVRDYRRWSYHGSYHNINVTFDVTRNAVTG